MAYFSFIGDDRSVTDILIKQIQAAGCDINDLIVDWNKVIGKLAEVQQKKGRAGKSKLSPKNSDKINTGRKNFIIKIGQWLERKILKAKGYMPAPETGKTTKTPPLSNDLASLPPNLSLVKLPEMQLNIEIPSYNTVNSFLTKLQDKYINPENPEYEKYKPNKELADQLVEQDDGTGLCYDEAGNILYSYKDSICEHPFSDLSFDFEISYYNGEYILYISYHKLGDCVVISQGVGGKYSSSVDITETGDIIISCDDIKHYNIEHRYDNNGQLKYLIKNTNSDNWSKYVHYTPAGTVIAYCTRIGEYGSDDIEFKYYNNEGLEISGDEYYKILGGDEI